MKKRFICWYAYSGMETEGRVELLEPKIIEAEDKAEAMWIWNITYRKIDMGDIYESLSKFRNSGEVTGWGFWCEELANTEQ